MVQSTNEIIATEAIRHQVALEKYTNNVTANMIAILNRSDARLFEELISQLARINPSEFAVDRLKMMLANVWQLNTAAYATMSADLQAELLKFTAYESGYQQAAMASAVPVTLHVNAVNVEQVYAAAVAKPFQGVLLKDALAGLAATRQRRIQETIAQGFTENKPVDVIVRELRGTRSARYTDGVFQVSRRDADAVVRTAVGHFAGQVQDEFAKDNADLIKGVRWSSTLDLKTTVNICAPRDGKMYTAVGHKPMGHALPWLGGPRRAHWRCRSAQVPVLKSAKELGLNVPEFTRTNGTRATMDGQIPRETSYPEWLRDQTAKRQDEVLGPVRGKALRSGKLSIQDMYNTKGEFLTLDELRAQDKGAL